MSTNDREPRTAIQCPECRNATFERDTPDEYVCHTEGCGFRFPASGIHFVDEETGAKLRALSEGSRHVNK